jgi:hypothetical protein
LKGVVPVAAKEKRTIDIDELCHFTDKQKPLCSTSNLRGGVNTNDIVSLGTNSDKITGYKVIAKVGS